MFSNTTTTYLSNHLPVGAAAAMADSTKKNKIESDLDMLLLLVFPLAKKKLWPARCQMENYEMLERFLQLDTIVAYNTVPPRNASRSMFSHDRAATAYKSYC